MLSKWANLIRCQGTPNSIVGAEEFGRGSNDFIRYFGIGESFHFKVHYE